MRSRNDQKRRLIVYCDCVCSPTGATSRTSSFAMRVDLTRSTARATGVGSAAALGAECGQVVGGGLLHLAQEERAPAEEQAGHAERLARPGAEVEGVALLDDLAVA